MKTNITLGQRINNNKILNNAKQWVLKHRKLSLAISILLIVCIVGSIIFAVTSSNSSDDKKKTVNKDGTSKKTEQTKYYSPLTGLLVKDEAATKMPVTAILIPNDTYSARPSSGLKSSGIVFEAICEGGITRFLALYQQAKPKVVGPIRSVRMYFISWLAPFNASVIHYGGNMDALVEIRNGSYRDVDQMLDSSASWRDPARSNPNNAFTSFEKIDAVNTAKGYIESDFVGFSRIDGKASSSPTATNINVDISTEPFNSSYVYDKRTNTYSRSQGGQPHIDSEGQITPSSIVVMNVEERSMSEPESHEEITTIGSGPVKIFQNGKVIEGTWNKPSQFEQIEFFDSEGNDIPLVRGQTWITAVPNGASSVTYTAPAPEATTPE